MKRPIDDQSGPASLTFLFEIVPRVSEGNRKVVSATDFPTRLAEPRLADVRSRSPWSRVAFSNLFYSSQRPSASAQQGSLCQQRFFVPDTPILLSTQRSLLNRIERRTRFSSAFAPRNLRARVVLLPTIVLLVNSSMLRILFGVQCDSSC